MWSSFCNINLYIVHHYTLTMLYVDSDHFSSCLTLHDPMDHSMPGLPAHQQLPESTQTHLHSVGDAIQPSHTLSSQSPAFNLAQYQDLFKWVRLITLIDLHISKNPSMPGINPTWSCCMRFLMCCWILFAKVLLKIFSSMFIRDIILAYSFLFCVLSLSSFGIRVIVAL